MHAKKINILLVDDRPDGLITLEAILRNPSYHLLRATSGAEALKFLLDHEVAVILLDVQMPNMNGFETAEIIRKNGTLKNIPIIFVTGIYGDPQSVFHGYELGAIDFITKPYDPNILRSKVAVLCDLYQKTKELERLEIERHERLLTETKHALEEEFQSRERQKEKEFSKLRLLHLVAESANKAISIDDAFKECLSEVCRFTNWPIGHVYLRSNDKDDLVSSKIWCSGNDDPRFFPFRKSTEDTRLSRGVGLPGRVLETKKATWVVDVTKDPNFPRADAAKASELRAAFAFPVIVGDEVVAVLEFFSPKDGAPDPILLEIMDHVGRYLGQLVQRKTIEQALRTSEERSRLVIEMAHSAFVGINVEGQITHWNPQAEKIFGWTKKDAIGKPMCELIIPEKYREAHKKGLAHFLATGEGPVLNRRIELTGLQRSGREFPVEITISPVPISGSFLFSAFIRDLTETKKAEKERERLLQEEAARLEADRARNQLQALASDLGHRTEELTRSNQELQQFASVASHDLKEPLRMVQAYVQLLQKTFAGKLDPKTEEYMAFIVEGASRMKDLINDLLKISEVGRTATSFVPLDCTSALESALSNLQFSIKSGGAIITHDELPHILGDLTQIIQLFQNLIGNALKYKKEGEPPKVHIHAEDKGKEWVFSVRDNGIGIEPEYRENIFVIFRRLHDRKKYPGTGVGLAICKKIVERHGGKIWVESEPGKGSVFCFTLPSKNLANAKSYSEPLDKDKENASSL
ncbi:PAS domain S-box protein [Candidatus Peregrinibacteria bacterium]|nr:PAS domain S-box protein [Candidatus Peregrinibacteria bacterium]